MKAYDVHDPVILKTAFMIYGPESAGNRLVRRILLAAGCAGDEALEQGFDRDGVPSSMEVCHIVWGRSVPGNCARGTWPRFFDRDIGEVRKAGYRAFGIVLVRDWFCMIESQLADAGKVGKIFEDNDKWTQEAYLRIFDALERMAVPFLVVSYEALVMRPERFVGRLLAHLGLRLVGEVEGIYDGNAKYYEVRDAG